MLVNLHTHLEGNVRPTTAGALTEKLGLSQPAGGWVDALQLDAPSNLTIYLEKVASTYPLFSDRESLTRITREAVEDAAADGQSYLELRFGPATHTTENFGLDEVIAAVCEGARQGSDASGMPAGVVVAALRLHDSELNEAVARSAARFADAGVVGFDLAGDELRFAALEPFVGAFGIARAAGLGVTCHAAEAGPASAALEAVALLGATRIGHGAHLTDDPEALKRIAGDGIVVEVCPTSNWYTGAIGAIAGHPAPAFRAAGVALVLGDDNPRQTGSTLSHEHRVLSDQLGFDAAALADLAETSVRAGFMADSVRRELRAQLAATLAR
ncbi:adenosine deaminase [Subtercola sp. RTI3]|uniref:adenosine deaminase n=1 Tax=Subtercola sp. RTI3 TaxID=3048639 RepID=UPI002B23EDB1|nr:adenosine deaminase [Subtercola sp. RTI3]MEA9986150.1 adenosine deaminase [Subtercola sp. RTI3]